MPQVYDHSGKPSSRAATMVSWHCFLPIRLQHDPPFTLALLPVVAIAFIGHVVQRLARQLVEWERLQDLRGQPVETHVRVNGPEDVVGLGQRDSACNHVL